MSIPRILIAEPIYQALVPLVYANRIQFWKNVWGNDVIQAFYDANSLIMGPRRNIRSGRAEAIRIAREKKASHILFLDDDVETPDHILQLLLDVDQDIVGGLMYKDDGNPIVFRKELIGGLASHWFDHPKPYPFECGGVGAGCMLIRTSVFDRWDQAFPVRKVPGAHRWYFNYDDTGMSMDIRFCRTAMAVGASVWCVPFPECQQLSHY